MGKLKRKIHKIVSNIGVGIAFGFFILGLGLVLVGIPILSGILYSWGGYWIGAGISTTIISVLSWIVFLYFVTDDQNA